MFCGYLAIWVFGDLVSLDVIRLGTVSAIMQIIFPPNA